ncbi:MAG: hypothetical protein RLZZ127_636 [Planctomycetota bacterium]|jgi:hypothetical protein
MTTSPSARSGSLLILIAAFLVMIAVLAFGFTDWVGLQRGVTRTMHRDALLRAALYAGRDHALHAIDRSLVPPADPRQRVTTLGQPWMTEFAEVAAGTDRWPDSASIADPAARRSARLALVAATGPGSWPDLNAHDLFRMVPGLASPAGGATPHGADDGYTVHPGTGRWFDLMYLDRTMRRPAARADAAYRVRYAVAVIDQQGLLGANRVRYEHLGGSAGLIEAWSDGSRTVPATGASAPGPDPDADPAQGLEVAALGSRPVRRNTWRPIPVDHRFLAHHLLQFGAGVENSRPGVQQDGFEPVFGVSRDSVGWSGNPAAAGAGKPSVYVLRKPGDLSDAWRRQGYWWVASEYPQQSDRFADFLPFEMRPYPVKDPNRGRAWMVDENGRPTVARDPVMPYQLPAPAGAPAELHARMSVDDESLERIRNRHPAHLSVLRNSDFNHYAADPENGDLTGTYPWDRVVEYKADGRTVYRFPDSPVREAFGKSLNNLLWSTVDLPNWQALAQTMRVPVAQVAPDSGSGTLAALAPSEAPATSMDGVIQLFTPFAIAQGQFDRLEKGSGTPIEPVEAKNLFEMSTQWPVNIQTAPRQLHAALVRLVCPELPDPDVPSVFITADTDGKRASYDRASAMVAAAIERWRVNGGAFLSCATKGDTLDRWLQELPSGGFRTAMQSANHLHRGLLSLINGGPSLRGPLNEYRLLELSITRPPELTDRDYARAVTAVGTASSTLAFAVVLGHHQSRFGKDSTPWNQDAEFRFWLATGGPGDPAIDIRRGLAPGSGGGFNRILSDPADRPFRVLMAFPARTARGTAITILAVDAGTASDYWPRKGYAEGGSFAALAQPRAADERPLDRSLFVDLTAERWRVITGKGITEPWRWRCNGPGLSYTMARSRTYRIAVRARIEDLQNPAQAVERSWDLVYRADPDDSVLRRTGAPPDRTGFADGDLLYMDLEGPRQVMTNAARWPSLVW